MGQSQSKPKLEVGGGGVWFTNFKPEVELSSTLNPKMRRGGTHSKPKVEGVIIKSMGEPF